MRGPGLISNSPRRYGDSITPKSGWLDSKKPHCLKKIIVSSSLCARDKTEPDRPPGHWATLPDPYPMRMGGPSVSWMDRHCRVGRGMIFAQT
jgi:hypothetical protein